MNQAISAPFARSTARLRGGAMTLTRSPWFVAFTMLLLAMLLDVRHLLTAPALKQVPLTIVLGVIGMSLLAGGFRVARPGFAGICFGLLLLVAAPGLIANKMARADSSLFSAVSLLLLPLSVYAIPRHWLRFDGRQLLRWSGWIGLAFIGGALVQLELSRRGLGYLRIHERAFLAPLVVLVPLFLGRRVLALAGLGAILLILVLDPRTTVLIVMLICASLGVYLYRLDGQGRRIASVLAVTVAVLAFATGPALMRAIDDQFKSAYGMRGNSDFRHNLLETGLREFARSPVFGDFFRGPTSFDTGFFEVQPDGSYELIMAPLHNDYLEFLTKGGLLGGSLLAAGLIGTLVMGMDNMRRYRRLGCASLSDWQGVMTIVVASIMFTILVNPVLNNPTCAVPAYFFVAQVWLARRHLRQLESVAAHDAGRDDVH